MERRSETMFKNEVDDALMLSSFGDQDMLG